ncbi:MAG: LytTR family DNA-binding domain-containing protein [Bacteroidales bacterium]|nr:LytTR family DNA-binding domain-containing protein [Bacteroidales bacterium]MCF8387477.1 LytTR family DNA-binding domain-containing protein [Bacteroidales bacterium]MCF8398903.1 LytTR family DNA-binding domain-containing protein [Bacteroidales bacterium]
MHKQEITLHCLAVDDEPLSLEVIEKYISEISFLKLDAKAQNAIEASEKLHQYPFDLIFLDINMPKISGIEFLKSLQENHLIIFTTAYPEFALEGFELDVVDYLLKPFSFARFLKAVNKAYTLIEQKELASGPAQSFILVKSDKRLHKIMRNDIVYVESAGDYVKVVGLQKTIVTHETMKNMGKKLDDNFIRIHKSFIINKNKIEFIEGRQVKIAGEYVPVGDSYKKTFFNNIGYKS